MVSLEFRKFHLAAMNIWKTQHQEPTFKYREPIIRWIDYGRRSWQRLGFIKIIASLASPSNTTNLEGMTKLLVTTVTSFIQIPADIREEVIKYIQAHRYNRYTKIEGSNKVELQDLFLSNPDLPSNTGAITGDLEGAGYQHTVYVEIPSWAVDLRILRAKNYTLTDRGKSISKLGEESLSSVRQFNKDQNPMLLTPGEQLFFLYCILDTDGDLIKTLFSNIVNKGLQKEFTRETIGIEVANALEDLVSLKMQKLTLTSDAARTMVKRTNSTIYSIRTLGQSPKEHFGTPRAEPLVDCGLLKKPEKADYRYCFSRGGYVFIKGLINAPSVSRFISTELAFYASKLMKEELKPFSPNDESLRMVKKMLAQSYLDLRSGLGYCSIREVALLTACQIFQQQSIFIEINDIERIIKDLSQQHSRGIRFTRSRQGDLSLMRIEMKLVKELINSE